ncbi:MAG: PocR ligand-binding domain-containing protein [Firmicutes bacterium]|nr:PocR ligand-binding domain-containing protein [Bacillota bacterium]
MHFKSFSAPDTRLLQEVQDSLARGLGVAALITDVEGRPITKLSRACTFCYLINRTPDGRAACAASRIEETAAAVQALEPVRRRCHAGLVHITVPVVVGGTPVGALLAGNVALEPPDPARVADLAARYGIAADRLAQAAAEVPVWDCERLERAVEVLLAVTTLFSELMWTRLALARRVEELEFYRHFRTRIHSVLGVRPRAEKALEELMRFTGATGAKVTVYPFGGGLPCGRDVRKPPGGCPPEEFCPARW